LQTIVSYDCALLTSRDFYQEIVVLSSKRRAPHGLPTILEDHGESRCSITVSLALFYIERYLSWLMVL
jgi:hypothetical protein